MLIDTHCHLQSIDINNNKEIINKSIENGVEYLIVNSYNLETSKEAIILSEENEGLYAAIGIGPDEVEKEDVENINKIEKLLKNKKVKAIGEIGLDYYHNYLNKEKQKEYFIKQLLIAKKNKVPVIIHCRKAYQDLIKILKEYIVKGTIHCFSGSYEEALELIKLGYKLGIGGVITYKNSERLNEIVQKIDISNILLETDTPYLTPEPNRGRENRPYYIIDVARKIAEIKNISQEEVEKITSETAIALFDLK